jgi:hypothetical protein
MRQAFFRSPIKAEAMNSSSTNHHHHQPSTNDQQQQNNRQPTSNQPRQRNNNQNGRPIRLHASTGICATEARKLHAIGQFATHLLFFLIKF